MKPPSLYNKLYSHFGPQLWWPVTDKGDIKPTYKKRNKLTGNQKLEICIGALLTQNTNWKNVEKAIVNLNREKLISVEKICLAGIAKLTRLIKPSGYYNQKARRVKLFCRHIEKNYAGSINKLLSKPTAMLREELLSLHGIGNETADSMLLYAAQKPVFVVDAYTMRILGRFYTKTGMSYVEVQGFFESQLPKDAALFNEYHALLVEFGKNYCKKRPNCGECFLEKFCAGNI